MQSDTEYKRRGEIQDDKYTIYKSKPENIQCRDGAADRNDIFISSGMSDRI